MINLFVIPLLVMCTIIAGAQSKTPRNSTKAKDSKPASNATEAGTRQKAQPESPFACVVDAFSPVERKRHFDELGPMLRGLKTGVRELKDGYEFQFPSDRKTFDVVSEWAGGEQRCCPFFDIVIRLEREGGPLWLQLTGRKGTKEFIRDDFAAWFKE
jgi:hypothetical protein